MKKIKLFTCGLIFMMMVFSTVYAIDFRDLKKVVDQSTKETKKTEETQETKKNQDTTVNQPPVSGTGWKCLGNTDKPENKVVISPDNKMMLTIDLKGKAKIYDYQTLKIKQLIESGDRADQFVSGNFYPNGQMVALGSRKGIAIYSIDGKLITKCVVPTKNLSISPAGNYLAVNSGGSITVLDANTLKTLGSITSCYSNSFVFLKEDYIIYLSLKGKLLFYSIKDGKEADLAGPSLDEDKSLLSISDDQQLLYLGGGSKGQVIKTSDWSTLCRFDDNKAENATFKHNSHDIACLDSQHKVITIYNAENGKEQEQFRSDSIPIINGFTFDQNANRLLVTAINGLYIMGRPSEPKLTIDSGSQSQNSKLASTTSNTLKPLFKTHTTVEHVTVSPNNQMILNIEKTGYVRVYDYTTLTQKTVIHITNGQVQTGLFYPDGKSIALGTENGIEVYSIDGKLLKKCALPTKELFITASGNFLVAKMADAVSIIDANTLKVLSTIKPFPNYMEKSSFALFKGDYLVYFSKENNLVFYSLKDGKPVNHPQPSIDKQSSLIAVSDDQQLMFVGGYKKGQVLKTDGWSTLCQLNNTSIKEVVFKHNSHELICSDNDEMRDMIATITIYNAENGTKLDQFRDESVEINGFTTDQSGKRLLIAGNGLWIMGAPSEAEIVMPNLGYRPMFAVRKTAITFSTPNSRKNEEFPVSPNTKIDVSNNEELHTDGAYWCKAQVNVDGVNKEVNGYISKDYVSAKTVTTIADFNAYKKVLQGSYQFKDFATIMQSPASYPKCFGEYSGELVGGLIEIQKIKNGTGAYLDITDFNQRFFVEIPSKEFENDWDGGKGRGWSEGDQITLYLKYSYTGTFTNELGMVFRIPVFRALALYDEYRVIYIK